jgi:hypothetical protein
MAVWDFFDYAELTGKNKISEWLAALPPADQAKIDNRLLQMVAARQWPPTWVSKYHSTGNLYEFRINLGGLIGRTPALTDRKIQVRIVPTGSRSNCAFDLRTLAVAHPLDNRGLAPLIVPDRADPRRMCDR